jgi:hypothetical protein
MRNAAVAEWILTLVATPDRAASTVGDLVEEAASRGSLWFWSCVLRTAGSHLWHDLTVSPLRMLGLAFRWLLMCWFLSFLIGAFVISVWIGILDHWGVRVCDAGGCFVSVPPWGYSTLAVVVYTAIPFLVGWNVARWSNGRELATALAVVVLFAAFYVVSINLSVLQVRQIGQPWPGMEHALAATCARAMFVVAGAILFRRRHNTAYSRAWR